MTTQPARIDYRPGTNVHPTQARRGLRAMDEWEPTKITDIGDAFVTLTTSGRQGTFHCEQAPRLRSLLISGRVPSTAEGEPAAKGAPGLDSDAVLASSH